MREFHASFCTLFRHFKFRSLWVVGPTRSHGEHIKPKASFQSRFGAVLLTKNHATNSGRIFDANKNNPYQAPNQAISTSYSQNNMNTRTFTIAERFNRDSHKSPTTPTTQIATPVAQRRPRFSPVIEKMASACSANPSFFRDHVPESRRHANPSRAKAVAVPTAMAPATPTQVLFGLATASRPGVFCPVAAAAAGAVLSGDR